jgi:hypothetical protein
VLPRSLVSISMHDQGGRHYSINCRPVDANGHCFVPTPKNQPSLDLLTSAAVLREFCCHPRLRLHLDLCLFLALLLRFVFAHFFILPSIRRRRHP